MKIIRDGKEIELTDDELEAAFRERDAYYLGEDVKEHWPEMFDGEEYPYDDKTAIEIGEKADDFLSGNVIYWDAFEEAINEFKEKRPKGE